MSHTKAARGIIEIYAVANTIRSMRNTAAEIQEVLHRPPLEIFIIDCQIIAHPHIDQNIPHIPFANP